MTHFELIIDKGGRLRAIGAQSRAQTDKVMRLAEGSGNRG